jgi:hygromycin-B 7''-O-kinase
VRVDELIRRAYPGSEIVPRSGGELNTVFEVRRSAGPQLIVKVYPPESTWKQAKEIHVYGLLAHDLGDAVPQVVHAEPPDRTDKTDAFTVLTKLDGVPLSETSPPDWRPIYGQLGALLAKIHSIRQPAYGYLTDQILDPLPTNALHMRRQFATKLDEFHGDPELRQQIAQYVDQRAALFEHNDQPVLCHNDFHEGNVLVDPETWQVRGFVDVENAIAADPLMDLAKTDYYSIHDDKTKLDGLLDGYGELPLDWRERITLYRLYHALELWDWFHSIGTVDPLDSIAGDLWSILGITRNGH